MKKKPYKKPPNDLFVCGQSPFSNPQDVFNDGMCHSSQAPYWVSTEGSGVAWLHMRTFDAHGVRWSKNVDCRYPVTCLDEDLCPSPQKKNHSSHEKNDGWKARLSRLSL